MVDLVLFETPESVIEILWDIALAFFLVRLASIYFLLTFISGAAITYLAYSHPQLLPSANHIVAPLSEAVLGLLLLLSSAFWARFVVSRYEIPRAGRFRLAMGAVALAFMLIAEAVVGLGLWEGGYGKWISERVGLGVGGLSVAFALMPFIIMPFEGAGGEEETWHGHEEKSIVDAVPMVSVSDKRRAVAM